MKNILVTIDFDVNTSILLDCATNLAIAFNAKIWLMHIAPPNSNFVGYELGPQYIKVFKTNELKDEHIFLHATSKEIKLKGIDVEEILIQGPTIEMIIKESQKLEVDMIIAGHHTHGFLYNAFVGSVSTDIIKESKIPVLIIPLDK